MITAMVETITPDTAYLYLEKNTKNYRKVNHDVAHRYAQQMKNGMWELNGEPITFNDDGILVNGQHRLTAVIESGCPVEMLVVRGVGNDVVMYDDGKLRSGSDIANALGVHASTRTLSVANLMVADEFIGSQFHRNDKYRVAEYAGAHARDLDLAASCAGTNGSGTNKLMRRSWAVAVAYMLIRDGRNLSDLGDYFGIINSGLPISGRECTPPLIIRNMMNMQPTLTRRSDEPQNMHYLMLGFTDFVAGVKRKKTYAVQTIMTNLAEGLWHKIRREDGIE